VSPRKSFVIVSQVYVPDPAAVGQHLADVAEELARRGHHVVVYTSSQGYDDPSVKYASRENVRGVDVRRIPFSSFGKSSILIRLAGGLAFLTQAIGRALTVGKVDAVLVSTSPPLAPLAGVALRALKHARLKYWVMDVNPDQTVALGMARPDSATVRAFDWMNRTILSHADDVVVLDRFMSDRMKSKGEAAGRMSILPPWPAEDLADPVEHNENPFRRDHVAEGKRVLMYSGNHGPSNPVTTIIEAARGLADDPRVLFMFIGGGVGKAEVDQAQSPNIVSLPYQPLETLRYSLSAADVHVVTVGDPVPGIVHPSKVYGAMAVGRPILLVGPRENHIADIMSEVDIGWHVRHGDVAGAVKVIKEIASLPESELRAKGERARAWIAARGGKAGMVGRMADIVERA
jgi:hypothetical protein